MLIDSCRICSSCKEKNDLVDLFSHSVNDYHAGKVKFCSGIELDRDDQMPQKICIECLQQVKAACRIKLKCIEADQEFRMQLKITAEQSSKMETTAEVKTEDEPEHFVVEQPYSEDDESIYADLPEAPVQSDTGLEEDSEPRPSTSKVKKTRKARMEDRRCAICHENFATVKLKDRHLKIEHANELTCRVCKKQKYSVVGAEKCLKGHQSGYSFLCQYCARSSHSQSALLAHINKVHTEKKDWFTCDMCGTTIKHKISLKRHMRTIHTNERFVCPHDTCPDIYYTTLNSLRLHLYRRHDAPAPVHCPVCNIGFSNATEIKAHHKSRGGCGSNRTLLLKPKRRVPVTEYCDIIDKMFHCNSCTKVYDTKKNMYDHHNNFHMNNKTCIICDKTFANNSNYRFHFSSVHDTAHRIRCDFPGCRKAYKNDFNLVEHKKVHEGQEVKVKKPRKPRKDKST